MAEVQAFRAFRYDLGRVGTLSDVIAPPYDVIDAALQQALYDRSPYNVIRLILNKEKPADTEHDNRYTRAVADAAKPGSATMSWCRTRRGRSTSIIKISRSRAAATRARASWRACAWRNLARAGFIRTRKLSPGPRPIG